MNINILAKSAFAILSVVALVSVVGYMNGGSQELLGFAMSVVQWVIIGSIAIAAMIHLPRLVKSL